MFNECLHHIPHHCAKCFLRAFTHLTLEKPREKRRKLHTKCPLSATSLVDVIRESFIHFEIHMISINLYLHNRWINQLLLCKKPPHLSIYFLFISLQVSWGSIAFLRPHSVFFPHHCICLPCKFLPSDDGFSWNCWLQCSVACVHVPPGEIGLRVKFRSAPCISFLNPS